MVSEGEDDRDWEEQELEIETLKSIFVEEELNIKKEKPYQFEILLNSNTESDDRNYLKLMIIFDLPDEYPNEVPVFRIKNLSPDYIDNNALEQFADEMRERASESLGQMMIFELTDLLKEKITLINERVLLELDKLADEGALHNVSKQVMATDTTQLNYTPVTQETFAAWCEQYKERIRLERLANRSENEDKPTGKELFLQNKSAFDDIVLEMTHADSVESGAAAAEDEEEEKYDEDDEEEDQPFVYDRALYDADGLEDDEDIDFDD